MEMPIILSSLFFMVTSLTICSIPDNEGEGKSNDPV